MSKHIIQCFGHAMYHTCVFNMACASMIACLSIQAWKIIGAHLINQFCQEQKDICPWAVATLEDIQQSLHKKLSMFLKVLLCYQNHCLIVLLTRNLLHNKNLIDFQISFCCFLWAFSITAFTERDWFQRFIELVNLQN